jgi:RNA polymerase sigma factor (sigma-70 family)
VSDEDFTSHVQANYDRWLRFVRGLLRHHAEDVVQSAVLKLWAIREEIDADRVDRLAFVVLRQSAVDQWRKEARPATVRGRAEYEIPNRSLEEQEAAQALRARLTQARGTFSARERRALSVWLIGHPSREEAAELLGVTKSAYSAAVFCALRKLKESMSDHYGALSEACEDLGSGPVFAVLGEVFDADLPRKS